MNPTAAGEDPVDRPVRPSAEALTVARILEIRDALLPSQGEPFDCVAFAVEIVKAERARLADECPAMPEPYTRQWINAPFTERLLFTEDQMRQYAANARLIAAAPEMLDVLRRVDVSIVGCEANATSRKHWQEDMEAVKEMVRQTLRAADGDA